MFKRRIPVPLLVFLLACAGCSGNTEPDTRGPRMGGDCDLHEQACAAVLVPGVAVTLDIAPKPVRAMTDLEFTVSLSDRSGPLDGAQVELELSMPGMFMGENRSTLSGFGQGVYRGKGVIPKCPSGKTLWRGDLHVRFNDTSGNAWFLFSVK